MVLWDLAEGKPRRKLKGHKGEIDAVAFSGDGRWIASGGRTATFNIYEVILWDARTGKARQTIPDLTEWVHAIAFSPDGKTLAFCGGGMRDPTNNGSVISSGALYLYPLEELIESEALSGPLLSFAPRERRLLPK